MELAITYARCSTKKQDLETQNAKLFEWAKKFDDHVHFEDLSISGRKESRKGINNLMKLVRSDEIKKYSRISVGVVELSRIGRSISFIHKTIEELSELQIKVILVNSNTELDYNSLEGRALIGGLSLAADIEWMLISERNQRGRERIKSEGIKVGPKKKEISMQAISALQEKGLSLRQIATELGSSPATIMRRIRDGREVQ